MKRALLVCAVVFVACGHEETAPPLAPVNIDTPSSSAPIASAAPVAPPGAEPVDGGEADEEGIADVPSPGSGTGQRLGGGFKTKSPTLQAGTLSVTGPLAKDVVQRIIRQNFGRFRLCYENGLRTNPDLAGKVTVKFTIDAKGAVTNGKDAGSDLQSADVLRCIARGYGNLSFPPLDPGKSVLVVNTIHLSPP